MVHRIPDRADEQSKEAEIVPLLTPPRTKWIDGSTGEIGTPGPIEHGGQVSIHRAVPRTFSRGDFDYNQETDIYICPAGKVLASTGTLVNDGATLLYRASKYDCDACELKPRCCPKMPARKVPRSIYENARDVARDIAKTETYVTSRRERKKIEMLFAHLKRILRLDRLRLRGPSGAQDEFLLAATVQNLRKMAKLIPLPAPMPA